jgi:hypothetical protein
MLRKLDSEFGTVLVQSIERSLEQVQLAIAGQGYVLPAEF